MIYHIAQSTDWAMAQEKNQYIHPSLETEGFIHFSLEHQVNGVLDRYYSNVNKEDYILLEVETDKLESELKFELAPSVNEEFPHLYGPLNTDAVLNSKSLKAY